MMLWSLLLLAFGVCAEKQIVKPTISTTLPANYQEAKYENEDFPSVSFLKVSDRVRSGRLTASHPEKVPEDFEESTYEGENFFDAPKNKKVAKMALEQQDSSLIETKAVVDKEGLTNSGKAVLRSVDTASWPIADYKEDMPEFLKQHPQPNSRRQMNIKNKKLNLMETSSSLLPSPLPVNGQPPPPTTFTGDRRYLYWTGADSVVPANLHANMPETLTQASRPIGYYSDGTPHAISGWDYHGKPVKKAAAAPP